MSFNDTIYNQSYNYLLFFVFKNKPAEFTEISDYYLSPTLLLHFVF